MVIRMIHQNILLHLIVVVLQLQLSATQNNSITFSPSTPLCIGETVQMICYVVPPTAEPFIDNTALISFNDSDVATLNTINNNTLAGIDTSRYTATVSGLSITTNRPGIRLTITDYQASDGATNFSCHGLLLNGSVPSPVIISGYPQGLADPPSSPVVTLSQTDNSCSNTPISWSTPSSDRSVTSYSVYRNNTLIYNGPNTTNQYTDKTQLNINTVYEYSVVAISCAGNSTAGVDTIRIGGYTLTSPLLSIILSEQVARFSWTLTAEQSTIPILIEYLIQFNYTSSDNNSVLFSQNFSQISTNSVLDLSTFLPQYNRSTGDFTGSVCIRITEQCGQESSGDLLCDDQASNLLEIIILTIGAIIGIGVGVCICCCVSVLILIGVIIVCVLQKKGKGYSTINPKKRSDTQELQEPKKMEGLYTDVDHTLPKPDTIKRPDPIEETLYTQVHTIDGPNQ